MSNQGAHCGWVGTTDAGSSGCAGPKDGYWVVGKRRKGENRRQGPKGATVRTPWPSKEAALKIAVIGGGSTYTPELVHGLLEHTQALPLRGAPSFIINMIEFLNFRHFSAF